ncbi:MAG: bifunctional adenosylcobinamide kinase/adenosylcobinamide-phosphate guanylyltransferase [Desulforhabdus sp.]|jgi:adenosylcobinamide kinase/adenosylcobinamide-phosphate guanylyltransferase|nr:bifunctional adenosylcobinamide kinase/adenosylcobinamide-phosphate guanylyltransferase [Desulforhabdus sp.]
MQLDAPPSTPLLVLGGAKSGKSVYAEQIVSMFPPPYCYIATAKVLDQEMSDRVREHRKRRASYWKTIESPLHLVEELRHLQGNGLPVLVDCITLWLSNLLLAESSDPEPAVDGLINFLGAADYPLVIVSNEVGAGIVPENNLARRFRDLAGRTNQRMAAICRTVTLIVAGLPVRLKEESGSVNRAN